KRKSALCVRRNRLLIAVDPGIERSIAGNDGALVGGNGFCDVIERHPFARKRSLEQGAVFRDTLEFLDQFLDWHVHFYIGLYRPQRLRLKRGRPAVTHEHLTISGIHDRGRPAAKLLHAMPNSLRLTIPPTVGGAMTGGARQQIGARQPRIEIEGFAECSLCRGVGIFFWEWD